MAIQIVQNWAGILFSGSQEIHHFVVGRFWRWPLLLKSQGTRSFTAPVSGGRSMGGIFAQVVVRGFMRQAPWNSWDGLYHLPESGRWGGPPSHHYAITNLGRVLHFEKSCLGERQLMTLVSLLFFDEALNLLPVPFFHVYHYPITPSNIFNTVFLHHFKS